MQNNLYNIRNENMKYYFKSKLRRLSKSSNIYKDVTENFILSTVPNNYNISFAKLSRGRPITLDRLPFIFFTRLNSLSCIP